MEGRLDVETSNWPCGRISRSLACAAMRKGEARMRRSQGPKPLRRTPLSDSPARRETPTVLNLSNRRIRTRMYGGVGGEESRDSPLSRFCYEVGQRRFEPPPRLSTGRRHYRSSPTAGVSSRDALAATRWRPHGVASTRAMQCKEGRKKC